MRKRRLTTVTSAVVLVVLALGTPVGSAAKQASPVAAHPSTRVPPEPPLTFPTPSPSRAAVTDNFEIVGHLDFPGTTGADADVWAFGHYAYVGVWQGAGCPANGVKVVDIADPAHPVQVSVLQNPAWTSAEDVVVRHVSTPTFTGDLAAIGLQDCIDDATQGLQLWNVTNPAIPSKLGTWVAPELTWGCHEIDLVQRADGMVLAGCAEPFARGVGQNEVILLDVADPKRISVAGQWVWNQSSNVGCFASTFAHSVRFFDGGQTVYVSNWDGGTIGLDISVPASPQMFAQTRVVPPDEDGDSHSMTLAKNGTLMLVNPEDFCVGGTDHWGEVYVFDHRNPSAPRLLGTFATTNSDSNRQDGTYTVHNTETKGNDAFSSWYSDGIVWWSLRKPRSPQMLGQFVPPNQPMVWGVALVEGSDLILASDMNSGLWIVRPLGA